MADQTSTAILQALQSNGTVSEQQLQTLNVEAIASPLELKTVLIKQEIIDEETFVSTWAQVVGLPYINVSELTIPKHVLTIIPESTARGHLIIAYEQAPEQLKVAMANPADRQIVEFIHKKVDMPVEVALASETTIRQALSAYQESLENELQTLADEASRTVVDGDLSKAAEDVPTIKVTDSILKHAILQGASDIHIEPTEKQVVIRYRVDGILQDVLTLPKTVLAGLVARIKVLSSLKIDEHRLPQDGRFKIESPDYKVAFRVSTLPVFDGEKVVMRLLDESGHGLGLDQIGMSARTLEIFRRNANKPHGMVLVTGPTGSGKTTTLYAAMKEINTPEVNVSTIEDPIEYRMPRINQTQVQPQIGLTFASGLRSLVRQDPDIIMVGEIRDEETASLAVNAALTGHLVLSTLHTNSAAGALPRLLDMKVEAFLVASTVNVLVAQRLVRKLCPKCKKESPFTAEMQDSLSKLADLDSLLKTLLREKVVPEGTGWNDVKVFLPGGCKQCHEGYKGRFGIYEVLEMTPEIQAMISEQTTSKQLEDKAREVQQMVTMLEDGVIKMVNGETTIEEVLRVTKE